MSLPAIRWAWSLHPKGPAKIVLLCLAWHTKSDGTARISIDRISDDCGLAPRTVQYALAFLIKAGLLESRRTLHAVTTYVLKGAPHAPYTTPVVTDAPGAPSDWLERRLQGEFEKGRRTGYKMAQEDAQRRKEKGLD